VYLRPIKLFNISLTLTLKRQIRRKQRMIIREITRDEIETIWTIDRSEIVE